MLCGRVCVLHALWMGQAGFQRIYQHLTLHKMIQKHHLLLMGCRYFLWRPGQNLHCVEGQLWAPAQARVSALCRRTAVGTCASPRVCKVDQGQYKELIRPLLLSVHVALYSILLHSMRMAQQKLMEKTPHLLR